MGKRIDKRGIEKKLNLGNQSLRIFKDGALVIVEFSYLLRWAALTKKEALEIAKIITDTANEIVIN